MAAPLKSSCRSNPFSIPEGSWTCDEINKNNNYYCIVAKALGAPSDIRERVGRLFSASFSLSLFFVDRLFRPFFHPTHGGRVLNYPGRTSSDCPAVIACQLSAFDVIKLILGLNFGPRQRAKGQLLSGFPLFAKNFPWGFMHRKTPSALSHDTS